MKIENLPAVVRDHPDLPGWLAGDVRHYWLCTHHPDRDDIERELRAPRPRDLAAILQALDRLEAMLSRLPLEANLDALRVEVERRFVRRRPGPRADPFRRDLESMVARDLSRAGIRLTKGRGGALALTLVAVYQAAGIRAPLADSLHRTLKRLVDHERALRALAERLTAEAAGR